MSLAKDLSDTLKNKFAFKNHSHNDKVDKINNNKSNFIFNEKNADFIIDINGGGNYTSLKALVDSGDIFNNANIFVRGGTYELSATTNITDPINLIGDFNNRPKFVCKPNSGNGGINYFTINFSEYNNETVNIKNIDFVGHSSASVNTGGERAFVITTSDYGKTIIENCTFTNIWNPWHGVIFLYPKEHHNLILNNNSFINCQNKGFGNMESNVRIYTNKLDQLLVINNYFDKRNKYGSAYNSAGSIAFTKSESNNAPPSYNKYLLFNNTYVNPLYDYNHNLIETTSGLIFENEIKNFYDDIFNYYYDYKSTNNITDLIYPIGSIYMSINNVNPSTLFGGIWEQLKDRFLLGAGDSYSNGATGGEATHTLTESEMPSHYHDGMSYDGWQIANASGASSGPKQVLYADTDHQGNRGNMKTKNTGSSQSHNNMPPYLVVFIWKRIK